MRKSKKGRQWGVWAVVTRVSAALVLLFLATGNVAARQFDLRIDGGTLREAVHQFREQADVEFIYPFELAEINGVNAVAGRYSLEEALGLMLEGTGLFGSLTEGGIITISRSQLSLQNREGELSNKIQRRSLFSRLAAGVSSGAIALLTAQGALGQVDENDEVKDTIVVTGLKSGAVSLEDAPVSVTALGGDALRDGGFLDVADAARFAPSVNEGVSPGNRAQKSINIRGIGQTPNVTGGTTGYYINDASFFSSVIAPNSRLYDIERVEIFRGPQSTLYGNGAMGGVVRFVPNAPNLTEFEGNAFGGWSATKGGSDNYYGYGAISLPLIEDKLAIRVAGGYEKVGGFGDTGTVGLPATGENEDEGTITSFRGSLLFQPTDRFSFDFLYQLSDSEFGALQSFSPFDTTRLISGPDDRQDTKYSMYAGTVKYDFGFAEFTNVTTYIEQDSESVIDVFFPGVQAVDIVSTGEQTYFGNEARLASSGDSPFNWLLGLFVTDDDLDSVSTSTSETLFPDPNPLSPFFGQTNIFESEGTSSTSRSTLAVFGEISYELFDGKLVPLVGLRYFEDKYEASINSATDIFATSSTVGMMTTVFDPPLFLFNLPSSEGSGGKLKFDSLNPRFNLAYYPNDNATYFINVANGFRGGTANTGSLCPITPGCPVSVPSDEVWSYEIGTKQSLFEGQLFLDLAAYYMEWQDVREFLLVGGAFNAQLAAGDAEIYGVDVGLTASPQAIPGLTLTFVGNWNSSEFSSITPEGAVNGAAVGERVSYVPEWTATVGLDYQRPIGSGWAVHVNASYNHVDAMRSGFGANALLSVPAGSDGFGEERDLVRARIGVKNDNLGVYFVGTNLLNDLGPLTVGSGIATLNFPRTLGFEISADF